MQAIIYKKENNEIIGILDNVTIATDTEVLNTKGEGHKGIDANLAGVIVVDAFSVSVSQVIGQREIIKLVLVEGGPELGIGDTIDRQRLLICEVSYLLHRMKGLPRQRMTF